VSARAELDLRALGAFLSAECEPIGAKVDPFLLLNSSARKSRSWPRNPHRRGRLSPLVDFTSNHAVADLEDRDVERAAAEIVDGDRLASCFSMP